MRRLPILCTAAALMISGAALASSNAETIIHTTDLNIAHAPKNIRLTVQFGFGDAYHCQIAKTANDTESFPAHSSFYTRVGDIIWVDHMLGKPITCIKETYKVVGDNSVAKSVTYHIKTTVAEKARFYLATPSHQAVDE